MISLRPLRRSRTVLSLILVWVWSPPLQATTADNFCGTDLDFTSGFELFHAGPQWYVDALRGSKRTQFRHLLDRAGGHVVESRDQHNGYVGRVQDASDVGLFGNVSNFARGGQPSASLPTGPSAINTVITWDGVGSAWLTGTNWSTDTVPGVADTATFATTTGSTSIGINFGNPTNNGPANQIVGAIALTGGELKSISNSSATAGTLTISGVGGALLTNSSTFDLTLQNSAGAMTVALPNSGSIDVTSTGNIIISSSVTGAGAITKTGAGTLIFSGPNLYSGGTTVNGGTLLVNNTVGSGTGSGAVTVNTGGTLGGTGTILAGSNNVTIVNGGRITGAAEGTVGSLTLNANTLDIAGTFLADISGLTADSLILIGNLMLDPTSTLDFSTLAAPTAPVYSLINYSGTLTGTFGTVLDTPMGYVLEYNPNSIDLVAVPEPGTWIGAALALGAIGLMSRKSHRAKSATSPT